MNTLLNGVVVVALDVHIWSGRKKLRPEDLAAPGKLPPKDLISLGSKKIFDPKALKAFADLKREADSLCAASGVRFARSYAVPRNNIAQLAPQLNDVCARFDLARDAFLATFDDVKTRWKDQHPGYERLIDTELLPKTAISQRLAFGYQVFAINVVDGDDNISSVLDASGASNIATGLIGQLYIEISTQARQFVKQSLLGRQSVTQKFLRPVRAMRDKLAGLAFLDASVDPLVNAIDSVLAQLPGKGMITGLPLEALRGVVGLLCDPSAIRAHGHAVHAGLDPSLPDDGLSKFDGVTSDSEESDLDDLNSTPPAQAVIPAPRESAIVW
jgi:Protein of unknown function (DUF3150)